VQEGGRRVDQFVEVFEPVLAFLVGQVMLAQAALSITWSITSGSGRSRVSWRRVSISRTNFATALPALPARLAAAL
jgi:hypothetical protein